MNSHGDDLNCWSTRKLYLGAMIVCVLAGTANAAPAERQSIAQSTGSAGPQHSTGFEQMHPLPHIEDHASKNTDISTSALAEIIVTAQKYQQAAFDVPISLAVVTPTDILRKHITSLADLQFSVPGLYVENTGLQRKVEIRGVSNDFGTGSLIGEYLDDADVSVAPSLYGDSLDLQTFDLQRIEVLRGPQGTLYGAGSIGGTIRYIANPPNLSAPSLASTVRAVFTEGGGPGESIQAAVNIPVSSGVFALRFSGESDHSGGWIDQPAAQAKDINRSDLSAVRIQALLQPTARFKLRFLQSLYRNVFGPNEGASSTDVYTAPFSLTLTPTAESQYRISNLTATYDFSRFEILSSTTHFASNLAYANYGGFLPVTPPPNSLMYYELIPRDGVENSDSSEELRLTSLDSGPWHWIVGGFYKSIRETEPNIIYYFAAANPPGSLLPAPINFAGEALRSDSWSGFADTSYRLFERLTLGAGIRFFRDNQLFTIGSSQSAVFDSTDPRFYVQYRLSRNINLYTSVSKGFRSGGFNTLGYPAYGPETLWSYELGSKLKLAADRLRINADTFYSTYANYVSIGYNFGNPGDIYRNSGTVHIKGVEGDITWKPNTKWLLSATADYIDGRFAEVNLQNPDYIVGDPVPMAPRYGLTTSIERDFTLDRRTGYMRVDYSQRPPGSYRVRSIGPWYYSQSSHFYLLDFTTGIRWSSTVQFNVFVQNLLNDRGYVDPFAIEGVAGRNRPRSYGLELHAEFD